MTDVQHNELKGKVETALEQIRPYLEADGGNVVLEDVTVEGVALLRLTGACQTCSMSMMTLKAGIEETVKRAVPEIKSVRAVNLENPMA